MNMDQSRGYDPSLGGPLNMPQFGAGMPYPLIHSPINLNGVAPSQPKKPVKATSPRNPACNPTGAHAAEVKNVYLIQGQRWSEVAALGEEERLFEQKLALYGIIHRQKPGGQTIEIVIQNHNMKDMLTEVFNGYPGFHPSTLGTKGWTFKAPFHSFVHRWSQLQAYREKITDPIVEENVVQDDNATDSGKEAATSLIDTMSSIVQPSLDIIDKIKNTELVQWEDIPLIFAPGELVIVHNKLDMPLAVRIENCTMDHIWDHKKNQDSTFGISNATLLIGTERSVDCARKSTPLTSMRDITRFRSWTRTPSRSARTWRLSRHRLWREDGSLRVSWVFT